jgi:flagellar export protein FliJ
MKPFKLQAVLDYRQTLSNIAQQDLCKTLEEEIGLTLKLQKLRLELDKLYSDFAQLQQDGITPHELLLYETRCSHKAGFLAELEAKRDALRRKITSQRQALCETDRDKKLIEKLKEKQTYADNLMLHRKETAELDEIATQKYGR